MGEINVCGGVRVVYTVVHDDVEYRRPERSHCSAMQKRLHEKGKPHLKPQSRTWRFSGQRNNNKKNFHNHSNSIAMKQYPPSQLLYFSKKSRFYIRVAKGQRLNSRVRMVLRDIETMNFTNKCLKTLLHCKSY